ncbi:MAG: hypothetical protein D6701_06395 [Gemmatimonadetes bacterium]|nr:MAG: hypothetical protein D6701_06395 [Gemmatimonadota bacterium]
MARSVFLRGRSAVLCAALVLTASACAHTRSSPWDEARRNAEVAVQVTNHNWSDVRVHVVHLGNRARLGQVTSQSERLFTISRSVMPSTRRVRFLITPIGSSERYTTDALYLAAGQRVNIRVENLLSTSSYEVVAGR